MIENELEVEEMNFTTYLDESQIAFWVGRCQETDKPNGVIIPQVTEKETRRYVQYIIQYMIWFKIISGSLNNNPKLDKRIEKKCSM